jgi:hypothetical protein
LNSSSPLLSTRGCLVSKSVTGRAPDAAMNINPDVSIGNLIAASR